MTEKLTINQQTVLNLLELSKEPLKAYAILFDIQKKGIKSPLQVYRALDKLIEFGKVFKIDSIISSTEGINTIGKPIFIWAYRSFSYSKIIITLSKFITIQNYFL